MIGIPLRLVMLQYGQTPTFHCYLTRLNDSAPPPHRASPQAMQCCKRRETHSLFATTNKQGRKTLWPLSISLTQHSCRGSPMPDVAENQSVVSSCEGCRNSEGLFCNRDRCEGHPNGFKKSYEIRFIDRDFCGPGRRYYVAATGVQKLVKAVRAHLQEASHD